MRGAFWTRVTDAMRRSAVPLASYYAVTLALPLANGAARSGSAFFAHAVVVLIVPPALIVIACAMCAMWRVASAARPSSLLRRWGRRLSSAGGTSCVWTSM